VEEHELEQLDSDGYVVLDAISHDRAPPSVSHASPHAFVCVDGRTRWVKRKAQHGLLAELVAARLGAIIGVAPEGLIIRVPAEAAPADGSADHLVGLGVGVGDQPGMENLRELAGTLPGGVLDPAKVDVASRVLVLSFQTWLGMGDAQILVDLRNGQLMSIDHGDWGSDLTRRDDPVIVPTPGLPDDSGRSAPHVEEALTRITGISDEQILQSVARVPGGADWNSARSRRLELARWVALRRDRLTGVMRAWQRVK
jgi:hypothetical protein